MESPVLQDRDRTAQQSWGTGIISMCCLRSVTKPFSLSVLTSPLCRQCSTWLWSRAGALQQHPAPRGHRELWMMAEPRTAQRCPHEHLSLQCRSSLACLCLGCCLHNGDNGISHRHCGNSAISTRETGDYVV